MAENIIEEIVIPEVPKVIPDQEIYVYVPTASSSKKGVASFNEDNFDVENGQVSIKEEYIENAIDERLGGKVLKDFTVDATTGIGTKYYNDGTTATVQFPIGGGGTSFESAAVTILTFTTSSWVQEDDGTYSLAYSSTNTGFTDNEYIANLAEATTENEVTGYLNRADTYFQGSDGSILIEGIETPFNGRLILLGKAVLEGQLISDLSLSGTTLIVTYVGGTTSTIDLSAIAITIDQTYDETSENAQSGVAVAQAVNGGKSVLSATLTLDKDSWEDDEQTVAVTLDMDNVNSIIYALASLATVGQCGVMPTAESSSGITFTCSETPTEDITFNILSTGVQS